MSGNRNSIVLLTGNHLCHNPRVLKEASALVAGGYDVEILGAWTDPRLAERDLEEAQQRRIRFYPVINLTRQTVSGKLARVLARIRHKKSILLWRLFRLETRGLLGATYSALFRAALRRSADLYIAHSEVGIAAASKLHSRGRLVAVDFEDWFSEDLLPEARRDRPVRLLRQLETELLGKAAYVSCPSQAMSRVVAREYVAPAPTVLYNAFPWADRANIDGLAEDRTDRDMPSIHWYSQTLGMGRGLEELFAALDYVRTPVQLHLRGCPIPGFDKWLATCTPPGWRHRLFLHGLVSNHKLLSRIAEHDIGFAGEIKYCRSRDLTVTNKILQYLLAGLAVIASDTEGQSEVALQAGGAVFLYRSGDALSLATRIDALLSSPEELARAKIAALAAAEQTFCWERQQSIFLKTINKSLR